MSKSVLFGLSSFVSHLTRPFSPVRPMTAQVRLDRYPAPPRPQTLASVSSLPHPRRACTKRVANPAHRTQRSVPSSRSSPTRAATPIPAPPMSSTASACPRRRQWSPSSRAPTSSSGWPPTACWTTSAPLAACSAMVCGARGQWIHLTRPFSPCSARAAKPVLGPRTRRVVPNLCSTARYKGETTEQLRLFYTPSFG